MSYDLYFLKAEVCADPGAIHDHLEASESSTIWMRYVKTSWRSTAEWCGAFPRSRPVSPHGRNPGGDSGRAAAPNSQVKADELRSPLTCCTLAGTKARWGRWEHCVRSW